MPEEFYMDWWTPYGQFKRSEYILFGIMLVFVIFIAFPREQRDERSRAIQTTPHFKAIEALMDTFRGDGCVVKEKHLGSRFMGSLMFTR